jgi:hypothetical protein
MRHSRSLRGRPDAPVGLGALLLLLAAAPGALAGEPLGIAGEAANNGIFDPSVEFDPNTGDGWLVYSAVSGSRAPFGPNVETHLAQSGDAGQTWSFVQEILSSLPGQILLGEQTVDGVWNHEVPSLAYDPGDQEFPWKLLAHRVFRRTDGDPVDDVNVPSHSWLVMYAATAPDQTWIGPVRTLASGPLPPPAYPIDVAINPLDPDLMGFAVYSEPGLFALGDTLYLSLTGLDGVGVGSIVLLESLDHGVNWDYRSTLLGPMEGAALGYVDFDGSSIISERDRHFLLASPGTPDIVRDGALLFEFEDLAAGSLVLSGGGSAPEIVLAVPLDPSVETEFGGQADFHELDGDGGILSNQLDVAATGIFQIRKTGVRPLPAPNRALGSAVSLAVLAAVHARSRAARGRVRVRASKEPE